MKSGQRLLGLWTALVMVFFYLPIVILIAYSFNSSRLNIVWQGFTFDWYAAIWRDAVLVRSLYNSLYVALITTVLSVILGVAGTRETVASGAVLLAVYSLGLGIPFIAAGLFAGPFMRWMRKFRGHIGKVEKAMGALLVVTGVLFVTGQITTIAFWMLSVFPGLAQLG